MTDVTPLDPTSPVGQLRLLTSDSQLRTDPNDPSAPAAYYYPDVMLEGFLAMNDGWLKLAAADVLMAFATNEALVSKKIRTEDLQTDGPAVAAELRRGADSYRAEGKLEREESDASAGSIVAVQDYIHQINPFDYAERVGVPLWY